MEISASMATLNIKQSETKSDSKIKNMYMEKLSKDDIKEIKGEISKKVGEILFKSTSVQVDILTPDEKFLQDYEDFQNFLKEVGYEGKPIAELSQEEATQLVSEDGFFGVEKTAQRIADFVINGAGGKESMFRAGKEGMLQGFKEAEEMWGDTLPDISQQTMQRAIELVDKAMSEAGFSILNEEA